MTNNIQIVMQSSKSARSNGAFDPTTVCVRPFARTHFENGNDCGSGGILVRANRFLNKCSIANDQCAWRIAGAERSPAKILQSASAARRTETRTSFASPDNEELCVLRNKSESAKFRTLFGERCLPIVRAM